MKRRTRQRAALLASGVNDLVVRTGGFAYIIGTSLPFPGSAAIAFLSAVALTYCQKSH